jgi:hypothetical protein
VTCKSSGTQSQFGGYWERQEISSFHAIVVLGALNRLCNLWSMQVAEAGGI